MSVNLQIAAASFVIMLVCWAFVAGLGLGVALSGVTPDTPLCVLHARSEADADRAEAAIRAAITFQEAPCRRPPNFYALVTKDGVQKMGDEA